MKICDLYTLCCMSRVFFMRNKLSTALTRLHLSSEEEELIKTHTLLSGVEKECGNVDCVVYCGYRKNKAFTTAECIYSTSGE